MRQVEIPAGAGTTVLGATVSLNSELVPVPLFLALASALTLIWGNKEMGGPFMDGR